MFIDEIKGIILDEFGRLEMENYSKTYDDTERTFYVGTFICLNPIFEDVVKDKNSLAMCLATAWMNLDMNEDEIRKSADKIFNYYDNSDICSESYDEDGY